MSKEAMKLALDALEVEDMACRYEKDPTPEHIAKAITALREALAEQKSGIKQVIELYDSPDQPAQQEPVAWMQEMPTQEGETRSVRMTTLKEHATLQWGNPIPLYTAPPQRTWIGLTDEEIDQGLLRSDYAFKTAEAWRAGVVFAMTKLKEKNK